MTNKLFFGDYLKVMKTLPEECCDLIYLDPQPPTPMPPTTFFLPPLLGSRRGPCFFLGHWNHMVRFQISQVEGGVYGFIEN
ncbi:MAG: hypothetical protein FJ333_09065 [Sphingomonadales bacterium]|nr:hypothetical protein [Sphingomonadales bacterium]